MGEDIAFFAGAHIMPMGERLVRVIGAIGMIAQHAAHQPDIGPADVLTLRVLHLQQRLKKKLELAVFLHPLRHGGKQTMQAVDQDHIVFFQLHGGVVEQAFSGFEVVERNEHFFPGDQVDQMLAD